MTAGHFGLAAAAKFPTPRIPLWALMLSTYLLDVVFIMLAAAGIESFAPLHPGQPPAYGEVVIQASYSHSLLGAAFIAAMAALLASRVWGRRAGSGIGVIVFSHWLLDVVVHRSDLPILPGNAANLPLLGLGLWNQPRVSTAIELTLVLAGIYLYYRSTHQVVAASPAHRGEQRTRALTAVVVIGLLLLLLLVTDVLALPLVLAIVLMLLLIILGGWLDARLNRPLPAT